MASHTPRGPRPRNVEWFVERGCVRVYPDAYAQTEVERARSASERAPKSRQGALTTREAGEMGVGSGRKRGRDILAGHSLDAYQVAGFFRRKYKAQVKAERKKLRLEDSPQLQSWGWWGGDRMWWLAELAIEQAEAEAGHKLGRCDRKRAANPDHDMEGDELEQAAKDIVFETTRELANDRVLYELTKWDPPYPGTLPDWANPDGWWDPSLFSDPVVTGKMNPKGTGGAAVNGTFTVPEAVVKQLGIQGLVPEGSLEEPYLDRVWLWQEIPEGRGATVLELWEGLLHARGYEILVSDSALGPHDHGQVYVSSAQRSFDTRWEERYGEPYVDPAIRDGLIETYLGSGSLQRGYGWALVSFPAYLTVWAKRKGSQGRRARDLATL